MAASCREIITVQFGHYANFVGTQWWNIQEASFNYDPAKKSDQEINHDILFREGQNLSGDVTYTPRLLLFDLKGSLNFLKQDGSLYDNPDANDDLQWSSDVTLHKSETAAKNDFLLDLEQEEEENGDEKDKIQLVSAKSQKKEPVFGKMLYNLDDQVKVWSDFLRPHFHPKTIQVVQDYWHGSDAEKFDVFNLGEDVVSLRPMKDEIEDRLHFFLEECDNLQGMHVLCDADDGFGGMASKIAEELRDEYSSKSILIVPVHSRSSSQMPQMERNISLVSTVMSYVSLMEHSSGFLPLSAFPSLFDFSSTPDFKYINAKWDLPYHSSSILACALESMSSAYRRLDHSCMLSHLTEALTPGGRKLLNMQLSMPFPWQPNSSLQDTFSALGNLLPWQSLTPHCHGNQIVDGGQSVVFQGLNLGESQSNSDEALFKYLMEKCQSSSSAICTLKQPCSVAEPFPHIFHPLVSSNGLITESNRPVDTGVSQVPLLTCLQNCQSSCALLKALHAKAKRLDVKRLPRCLKAGLEEDTFKENVDALNSFLSQYED